MNATESISWSFFSPLGQPSKVELTLISQSVRELTTRTIPEWSSLNAQLANSVVLRGRAGDAVGVPGPFECTRTILALQRLPIARVFGLHCCDLTFF